MELECKANEIMYAVAYVISERYVLCTDGSECLPAETCVLFCSSPLKALLSFSRL